MPDIEHPSMEEYFGQPVPPGVTQVLFCGREDCLATNRVDSVREEYLFHLVTRGRGFVRDQALGPGEGFFLFPHQRRVYRPDLADPWSYRWVGFHGAEVPVLLAAIGVDADHPLVRLADPAPIEALLQDAMGLLRDRPPQGALRATAVLYRLLAELAAGSSGPRTDPSPVSPAEAARAFIESHYHRGITVEDVAGYVGLDPSYLLKLFRSRTGLSLRDFLIETRLNQAKMLLKDPQVGVAAAAQSVGFRNYASFEKTFRRRTGRAPTEYRGDLFF